ncbi:MAG: hypothetical protein RLZZ546_2829 [Bacteroidota bacterium]
MTFLSNKIITIKTMKQRILNTAIASMLLLLFLSNKGGRNQATTGAPFESNSSACAQCHGGGNSFNPMVNVNLRDENDSLISKYIPGKTYKVEIKFSNSGGSPVNYGFQAVTVDPANNQAGEVLSLGADVRKLTITNRTYLTQIKPRIDGNFTYEWKAPDADSIKLFVSGIATNNNSNTSGDKSVKSSFTFQKEITSYTSDLNEKKSSYTIENNYIYFNDNSAHGEIYNLHGVKVQIVKHGELLNLKQGGIYLLKYNTNNHTSKTIKFYY